MAVVDSCYQKGVHHSSSSSIYRLSADVRLSISCNWSSNMSFWIPFLTMATMFGGFNFLISVPIICLKIVQLSFSAIDAEEPLPGRNNSLPYHKHSWSLYIVLKKFNSKLLFHNYKELNKITSKLVTQNAWSRKQKRI